MLIYLLPATTQPLNIVQPSPSSVKKKSAVTPESPEPEQTQEIVSKKAGEEKNTETPQTTKSSEISEDSKDKAWEERLTSYKNFCRGKSKKFSTRTQKFYLTGQSASKGSKID